MGVEYFTLATAGEVDMTDLHPQPPDHDSGEAPVSPGDFIADPALDGWAHFTFSIQTEFRKGTSFLGYDPDNNEYFQSYVHPDSYRLLFSVVDGMHHGARPPAMARAVSWDPRPRNFDILDFEQGPLAPPDLGDINHGPPLIPETVWSFDWTVTGDGGYEEKKTVSRHDQERAATGFDLPGMGNYSANLHVNFTNGRCGEQTGRFLLRDFLIVSLGDSSASGEGNPDRSGIVAAGHHWQCDLATLFKAAGRHPDMHIGPGWMEEKAHRSLTSGPAMAALSLQHTSGRTLVAGAQRVVLDKITFLSFARSGARVIEGLLNAQTQPPSDDFIGSGQVEEARRTVGARRINALLINVGGNDIGFSGVLEDLVRGDNVFTAGRDDDPAAVEARLDALLVQLGGNYDLLKSAVDDNLRPPDTYITGYPTALFDVTNPDGSIGFHACGLFQGWDLDIDPPDYDLIREKGAALNFLIRRKARQFGWHFIDIEADFVGHGYCDGDSLWVGASESCRTQGDFDGTMHPNWLGHLTWARKFVEQLKEHTVVPVRGLPTSPVGPIESDPRMQVNL